MKLQCRREKVAAMPKRENGFNTEEKKWLQYRRKKVTIYYEIAPFHQQKVVFFCRFCRYSIHTQRTILLYLSRFMPLICTKQLCNFYNRPNKNLIYALFNIPEAINFLGYINSPCFPFIHSGARSLSSSGAGSVGT